MNVKRRTFSLNPALDEALTYLHRRLGVSKSAVVNELLTGPALDLQGLMSEVPEKPTPEDVVRLRGRSVELVKERMAAAGVSVDDDQEVMKFIMSGEGG